MYVMPAVSSTMTKTCHCLLRLLHVNVVSLCCGVVTTDLVSLQDEESALTLGVLDVHGLKERFDVKNAHTRLCLFVIYTKLVQNTGYKLQYR